MEISTEELKGLIDKGGDYILIDVREKSELDFGMIPSAINISLVDLLRGLQKFDKNSNLIFYCRTGSRSEKATQIARNLGFRNAKNYKGSIWQWSTIDDNVKRYGPGS